MTTRSASLSLARVDDAGVGALREAIRHTHGCDSRHIESVPVRETFEGETVWDGEVQVFELIDHRTAEKAYAWSHETEGGKRRFYAVLHTGPVDGPLAAVRASIIADAKQTV
jgi:hypothetical protein